MKTFCHHFTGRVLLIKIDFNCHHTFGNHHKLMSENWFLIGDEKFDWEIVVMKTFKLQSVKQRASKILNNSSRGTWEAQSNYLWNWGKAKRQRREAPDWDHLKCYSISLIEVLPIALCCALEASTSRTIMGKLRRGWALVESKQRKSAIKLANKKNFLELLMT